MPANGNGKPKPESYVLAKTGHPDRSAMLTRGDLQDILSCLLHAAGGTPGQEGKDRLRSLAHRVRGAL